MRKRIAGVLIITLLTGMILSHMPFVAEAEAVEEAGLTVTMTELYNERYNLEVKNGDTVTIESAEELRMWSSYSYDTKVKNPDLSGVTVELLQDIRYASGTFSYDEPSGRVGFYLYEELKGTYDVKNDRYYPDFISKRPLELAVDGQDLYDFIYGKEQGYVWWSVDNFAGTFDGNRHCIAGLWRMSDVKYGDVDSGILFNKLDGSVKNLKLTQCYAGSCDKFYHYGGAICGVLCGTIENCHTADICMVEPYNRGSRPCYIGGLAGWILGHGTITDCSAETDIVCGAGSYLLAGGLVGKIDTSEEIDASEDIVIKGNYTAGTITIEDKNDSSELGGMIGYVSSPSDPKGRHGTIENCVSEVDITGGIGTCGGIVGCFKPGDWLIQNCENRGEIFGRNVSGGIVGSAFSVLVNQCRNVGHVAGRIAGGVVGAAMHSVVVNTENTGDVSYESPPSDYTSGYGKEAGGMFGGVRMSVFLYNSFCSGAVIAEDGVDAGIIAGGAGLINAYDDYGVKVIIDNVCAYGTGSSESGDDALIGNIVGETTTEIGKIYYPGQDVDSQCEALNTWVEKKGEVEFNYKYAYRNNGVVHESGTFACKKWMRGEDTPILQIEDSLKPNKPEPIPLPVITPRPAATPTAVPTATPTENPTPSPTLQPTETPTAVPTAAPTATPTEAPTPSPTLQPTETPTAVPTPTPTTVPTATPTAVPTPTEAPTSSPTPQPTETPTAVPTPSPTAVPIPSPTPTPTAVPTPSPPPRPTATPTPTPTPTPTQMPTPAATPTPSITQIPTTTPISTQKPIQNVPTENPVVSDIPDVTGIRIKAKSDASLMIQWKQVPGVSGYSITRSSKKNSGYRELSCVASNARKWCDRSVKEKKTYYYRVVAYRMIQGKRVYGVWHGTPKRITVKLRAPSLTVRKKKSEDGQRYLQIKIKKYRASGVELWVKKGKKPFRRIKLHGVDKKKKTNWINLSYTPSKQTLYLRARINQKKRYVSYMSKTKRIRIG